jgi:hypothetical protein
MQDNLTRRTARRGRADHRTNDYRARCRRTHERIPLLLLELQQLLLSVGHCRLRTCASDRGGTWQRGSGGSADSAIEDKITWIRADDSGGASAAGVALKNCGMLHSGPRDDFENNFRWTLTQLNCWWRLTAGHSGRGSELAARRKNMEPLWGVGSTRERRRVIRRSTVIIAGFASTAPPWSDVFQGKCRMAIGDRRRKVGRGANRKVPRRVGYRHLIISPTTSRRISHIRLLLLLLCKCYRLFLGLVPPA